jgi:hypothetical protein
MVSKKIQDTSSAPAESSVCIDQSALDSSSIKLMQTLDK